MSYVIIPHKNIIRNILGGKVHKNKQYKTSIKIYVKKQKVIQNIYNQLFISPIRIQSETLRIILIKLLLNTIKGSIVHKIPHKKVNTKVVTNIFLEI